MKKSFLTYLIALLIVTGIFAYVVYSQRSGEINVNQAQIGMNTSDWKIYTNEKFGYSIKYPADWSYREFPDTQTGAGFRPLSLENTYENEVISIDIGGSYFWEENPGLSFKDYAKVAATHEIQNYESLDSIEQVTTDSGLTGYKTTWKISASAGEPERISNPITYFDNKKAIKEVGNMWREGYQLVEVFLHNSDYSDIYSEMIKTFKLIN